MTTLVTLDEARASAAPGWPELCVGLLTYVLVMVPLVVWMAISPEQGTAMRGNVGGAVNGVAGMAALLAACALRIRRFAPFGFRAVAARSIATGAVLGLMAFGLSFLIEGVYFHFIDEVNTQADLQAAAKAGAGSLFLLVVTGGILTPIGEEVLFRGVVATALNRYGAWSGVVGSALIFAAVHGPSVIFLLAFMVGLIAGWLLRRTGSIWPCLSLHMSYNSLHLLYYATL